MTALQGDAERAGAAGPADAGAGRAAQACLAGRTAARGARARRRAIVNARRAARPVDRPRVRGFPRRRSRRYISPRATTSRCAGRSPFTRLVYPMPPTRSRRAPDPRPGRPSALRPRRRMAGRCDPDRSTTRRPAPRRRLRRSIRRYWPGLPTARCSRPTAACGPSSAGPGAGAGLHDRRPAEHGVPGLVQSLRHRVAGADRLARDRRAGRAPRRQHTLRSQRSGGKVVETNAIVVVSGWVLATPSSSCGCGGCASRYSRTRGGRGRRPPTARRRGATPAPATAPRGGRRELPPRAAPCPAGAEQHGASGQTRAHVRAQGVVQLSLGLQRVGAGLPDRHLLVGSLAAHQHVDQAAHRLAPVGRLDRRLEQLDLGFRGGLALQDRIMTASRTASRSRLAWDLNRSNTPFPLLVGGAAPEVGRKCASPGGVGRSRAVASRHKVPLKPVAMVPKRLEGRVPSVRRTSTARTPCAGSSRRRSATGSET